MAVASAASRLVWICWTRISWAVEALARPSAVASRTKVERRQQAEDDAQHDQRRAQPAQPSRRGDDRTGEGGVPATAGPTWPSGLGAAPRAAVVQRAGR